jgi:hypothetical protein
LDHERRGRVGRTIDEPGCLSREEFAENEKEVSELDIFEAARRQGLLSKPIAEFKITAKSIPNRWGSMYLYGMYQIPVILWSCLESCSVSQSCRKRE